MLFVIVTWLLTYPACQIGSSQLGRWYRMACMYSTAENSSFVYWSFLSTHLPQICSTHTCYAFPPHVIDWLQHQQWYSGIIGSVRALAHCQDDAVCNCYMSDCWHSISIVSQQNDMHQQREKEWVSVSRLVMYIHTRIIQQTALVHCSIARSMHVVFITCNTYVHMNEWMNNNNNSSGYALAMWPSTSHLA
jgi:hypothetical protein